MIDELTIITVTVGDSARRLDVLLSELRKFHGSKYPRHIVVDDGTMKLSLTADQLNVCQRHGVEYYSNSSGHYGLGACLSFADSLLHSYWIAIIEDAVRPSYGWLEQVNRFLTSQRRYSEIGMIGCPHVQDWMLAASGIIDADPIEVWRDPGRFQDQFYGGWNNGCLTWLTLSEGMRRSWNNSNGLDHEVKLLHEVVCLGNRELLNDGNKVESLQNYIKFRDFKRWPEYHGPILTPYPGPIVFIRKDALDSVGGFNRQCTFWEGHLGVRMLRAGWLVYAIETPPWFHTPSRGFSWLSQNKDWAKPRVFRGTDDIFKEDFGGTYHDVGITGFSQP